MTALPPVAGVVKVRFFWSIEGYGAANIMHWGYTGGPPDATTCADLAFLFRGQFVLTNAIHAIASNATLLECRVTDLSSDTGAEGQDIFSTAGGDSAASSNWISVVAKLPIALRYRGGHPKIFFPPFGDDKKSGGSTWDAGRCATFQGLLADWRAACAGQTRGSTTTTDQVAVSYFSGHILRPSPLVLSCGNPIVDTRQGSQRRRRLQPVHI